MAKRGPAANGHTDRRGAATEEPYAEGEAYGGPDPQKRLKRRRLWKKLRWLLWLLLLVPFIYLATQVFIIMAPQMRYATALMDTMTDAITVQGQVVQSMTTVNGGGTLYYTVGTGQRVAAGAQVAQVFAGAAAADAMAELEEIDAELALLEEAQATTAEAGDLDPLLNQMQAGLFDLLKGLESGQYAATDAPKHSFALAANKLQIATGQAASYEGRVAELNAQKTSLQQLAVPTGEVTAPQGGYFVPSGPRDRLMPAYDTLAEMDPARLQQWLAAPAGYYGDEVAGHIVTDYRWHFFTVVTAKQSEKFTVGDRSLTLRFPDWGDVSVPVIVDSVEVDEVAGLAKVVLLCEYNGAETMQLRLEKAQVVFGEMKGIRIDKNALRLVDETDENGVSVTYRGVYVKFGNMVYFRKITPLVEDDFDMLVPDTPEDGVNEVQLFDEIVIDSGGVELYDRKII